MEREKIRLSKEKQDRKFIKEELKRYYIYKDKVAELNAEIKKCKRKYKEEVNDPHVGGSIAKRPENMNQKDNVVMKWEGRIADLESNKRYYRNQCHRINQWLSVLTESQYTIVMKYVCEYQCEDRWHAATDLKCDSETVKTQTKLAIERIRKNFKEFI